MFLKAVKVNSFQMKFNSKWELIIYKRIRGVLESKYFPILVNSRIRGCRMELDIYIPKLKLAFELQGPLHVMDLKKTQGDLVKYIKCKNLGIKIIYLNFSKYYSKSFFQNVIRNHINKTGFS